MSQRALPPTIMQPILRVGLSQLERLGHTFTLGGTVGGIGWRDTLHAWSDDGAVVAGNS